MNAVLDALYTFWNQVVYVITSIRIFDIIDIAVIAYLIYKGIGFLRETRAGQLVKGIVVLLVAFAFAEWFELTVLKWLLTLVVDSAIIALAVIFQPELRRMLEKVGQTKISHAQMYNSETEKLSRSIDDIGKAVRNMQEEKIGALIVFERTTQLGEIINTGTVVDAKTSVSAVNSIFFPNSPLHDGALIVRDGRLYAAGCILPLSQNPDIPSNLGTRHRAAIGMTENSDAVVLVVSEETGNISIMCNGQIKRGYNSASATAELKSLLIETNDNEKQKRILSAFKKFKPFSKKQAKSDEGKEDMVNEK